MATLTWRDVAGGVRAPDLSEATDAITRGILGLGASVQQLANAPKEQEQERIANQMALAITGQKFLDANAAKAEHDADRAKKLQDDAAMREFGAAQSILEASAREAAIGGRSFDDFAKSDAYLTLSPEARAYGAAHLSDAFGQGLGIREQRLDNQRQESHFQQQMALQRQQEARQAREFNLRVKALEQAERAATGGLNTKDPETRLVLGDFTRRVAGNLFEAGGHAYEGKSLAEIAKQSGISDISEATESLNQLNAQRKKQGKAPLPEGVLKSLIAGQSGKNGWLTGLFNGFDQGDFESDLAIRADMYDSALMEDMLLRDLRNRANKGHTFSSDTLQAEFDRLKPVVPVTPTASPMDNALVEQLDPRSRGSSASYRSL